MGFANIWFFKLALYFGRFGGVVEVKQESPAYREFTTTADEGRVRTLTLQLQSQPFCGSYYYRFNIPISAALHREGFSFQILKCLQTLLVEHPD